MIARLGFAHPSRQRLQAWLDGADDNGRVTGHVEQCERCASRIEELSVQTGADDEKLAAAIGHALRSAYAPPDGINDRVVEQIKRRQLADSELNILLGLFSIPRDAAELLLPSDAYDPTERDDRAGQEE